jgi:hypothetical protein
MELPYNLCWTADRLRSLRLNFHLSSYFCFGGVLLVLLAGDQNSKHVDRNSSLIARRGKLLRDYAVEKSCLIFGREFPTTIPYNPSATPDVMDIVISRHLASSVHLTSCYALSSDHLG